MSDFWIVAVGCGMAFHGLLILWVGGLPNALSREDSPVAEKGSTEAFGIFWLDQYSYIGLALTVLGAGLVLWGTI